MNNILLLGTRYTVLFLFVFFVFPCSGMYFSNKRIINDSYYEGYPHYQILEYLEKITEKALHGDLVAKQVVKIIDEESIIIGISAQVRKNDLDFDENVTSINAPKAFELIKDAYIIYSQRSYCKLFLTNLYRVYNDPVKLKNLIHDWENIKECEAQKRIAAVRVRMLVGQGL